MFSYFAAELRSGDIAIVGTDSYGNLHAQLMSWAECRLKVAEFCGQAGILTKASELTAFYKDKVAATATTVDAGFPSNTDLSFEDGRSALCRRKGADPRRWRSLSTSGCPSADCWTSSRAAPTWSAGPAFQLDIRLGPQDQAGDGAVRDHGLRQRRAGVHVTGSHIEAAFAAAHGLPTIDTPDTLEPSDVLDDSAPAVRATAVSAGIPPPGRDTVGAGAGRPEPGRAQGRPPPRLSHAAVRLVRQLYLGF